MSTLIIELPAPTRLRAQPAESTAAADELEYVFSADGEHVTQHGNAALDAMPRAQTIVVALPADALSWHQIACPKAPAAKMRAALGGILEDQLLEDEADVHLALQPHARAGLPVWVAALDKGWLRRHLTAMQAAGLIVDRVVPVWAPATDPEGHIYSALSTDGSDAALHLAWRDPQGVICLPLDSETTRGLLAALGDEENVRWSATPEAAAAAARLTGAVPVSITGSQVLVQAANAEWNLLQFDMVPQRRASRLAKEYWLAFAQAPRWRVVRWGLVALIVAQVIGMNLMAWRERNAVQAQKVAMTSLLQSTFPQVRAVLDAPTQMKREVDQLRAGAGRVADSDLEPMLAAANAAWPSNRAPADAVQFEPGRLMLSTAGWTPPEVEAFRTRIYADGYGLEDRPGQITLLRPTSGGRPPPPRPMTFNAPAETTPVLTPSAAGNATTPSDADATPAGEPPEVDPYDMQRDDPDAMRPSNEPPPGEGDGLAPGQRLYAPDNMPVADPRRGAPPNQEDIGGGAPPALNRPQSQ